MSEDILGKVSGRAEEGREGPPDPDPQPILPIGKGRKWKRTRHYSTASEPVTMPSLQQQNPQSAVGNTAQSSPAASRAGRRVKRLRRHRQRKTTGKRLRRVTQPAPSNTNEFLMHEHDILSYHDHHLHLNLNSAGEDDRASEELNHTYSSPEDEEEFLARDFTAAYEVVHTERLSTMTRNELITEYQLLEERIEALEKIVKSGGFGGGRDEYEAGNSGHGDGDGMSQAADEIPSYFQNGNDEPCPTFNVQNELSRLLEENRQLKAENRVLKDRNQLTTTGEDFFNSVTPTTSTGANSINGDGGHDSDLDNDNVEMDESQPYISAT